MTLETRQFIDVDDIKSIQIECSGCKIKTFYSLDSPRNIPPKCPHCDCDWFTGIREMDNAVRNLKKAVNRYEEDKKLDAGMRLSIEITPPEPIAAR